MPAPGHETPQQAKPLRADARRNRGRVLAAAEQVFDEHGTGASTEQVARAAGVGVGTVFRHFPTKEALLEAVFLERLDRLAAEAEALVSAGETDPGEAFFRFFRLALDHAEGKAAFAAALSSYGVDPAQAGDAVAARLRQALRTLLDRAQRAGAVRGDLTGAELKALLIGAAHAVAEAGPDPAVRGRITAVLADGLRPPRG